MTISKSRRFQHEKRVRDREYGKQKPDILADCKHILLTTRFDRADEIVQ